MKLHGLKYIDVKCLNSFFPQIETEVSVYSVYYQGFPAELLKGHCLPLSMIEDTQQTQTMNIEPIPGQSNGQ